MKKPKKHNFYHSDPEKALKNDSEKDKSPKGRMSFRSAPDFVYRDLKKTCLIILAFVITLFLLYGIQIKTALLTPVLKKFGL